MFLDRPHDLDVGHLADQPVDAFPGLEQQQRGNALDPELIRQLAVRVDVRVPTLNKRYKVFFP